MYKQEHQKCQWIILQINNSVIKFFMDNQIICPSCNEQYRDDNLPRILIGCGHTFCESCLLSFVYEEGKKFWARCPEDCVVTLILEKNINKFPKNLALIKVIEAKKQTIPFKENDMNVSKITKNSEPQEEQDSNQLINIMDGTKQDCPSVKSQDKSQKSKSPRQIKETKPAQCPVHKKPMDIVCTVDLTKICASCAIFGDHRGHSFKSLEQVSQIKDEYCDEITAIINQKQKLSKQISCTQTKNDLIGLLTSKRNKLRNKIMQEFQKIETKISNKKKETLKRLDEIVKKQQNNLKNCMKFNEQLIKSYDSWFKKSDSQLKILEQNDFEAKLILLFEGKNIDGDLVEEGKNIISQMKIEEENILEEVEKKLENLSMNVNEEVYNYIDDFIHVTGESYKQISAIIVKTDPQALYIPPINMNYQQGKGSLANSKIKNQGPEKRTEPNPKYEANKNSYLKMTQTINSSPNLDESLLENDQEAHEPDVFQFSLRMSEIVPPNSKLRTAPLSQRLSIQPNTEIHLQKPLELKLKTLKNQANQLQFQNKVEKMSKKKLTKMKLPERFEKVVEALLADSLQIFDLTNAEVGDSNMAAICQNMSGSKVRTLKLIRNKLTDEGVSKLLPFLGNITTLNLSQNLLTDNVLDILHENKKYLPCLRTVILSQNKIVERKHKLKVDKLKKLDWNVSI